MINSKVPNSMVWKKRGKGRKRRGGGGGVVHFYVQFQQNVLVSTRDKNYIIRER